MSDNQIDENRREHQPIFNLPGSVAGLIGVLIAIHVARTYLLDDQANLQVLNWFAFISLRLTNAEFLPGGWVPLLWTPLTHALLHAGWEHVLINSAWLAVFGSPVAVRYGPYGFLLIFAVSAIAGAFLFAALAGPGLGVLVGASGGISGLTGAAIRFMFQPIKTATNPETGETIVLGRETATFAQLWQESRPRGFILVWLGLNAIVPFLPGVLGGEDLQIAWQAHIGGFVAGLLLVPLIDNYLKSRHSVL